MTRPQTYTDADIIEAGRQIEAEGVEVFPTAIRDRLGGGRLLRIRAIWDAYTAQRTRDSAARVVVTEVLPERLLEMLVTEQDDYVERSSALVLSAFLEAERHFAEKLVGEEARCRAAADDAEDRLAQSFAENEASFDARQIAESIAAKANNELSSERRRTRDLNDQLIAAEATVAQLRDEVKRARAAANADVAGVRAELAAMLERAARAEARSA